MSAGNYTDIEKSKRHKKESNVYGSKHAATNPLETRNLSIDKIREENTRGLDKATEQLKDKIRKNLEMLRSSKDVSSRHGTNTALKTDSVRNITPNKTRHKSSMVKISREMKTSERKQKQKPLSPKHHKKDSIKDGHTLSRNTLNAKLSQQIGTKIKVKDHYKH